MERKMDAVMNRIYEDFEPETLWRSEPEADTIILSLPGFRKEQLKVQVTSTRKLRLMGERAAGGNKWIRFRKEFPIPPNFDIDTISAKFENGALYVRHPKIDAKEGSEPKPAPADVPKPQIIPPTPPTKTDQLQDEKINGQKKPPAGSFEAPSTKSGAGKEAKKEEGTEIASAAAKKDEQMLEKAGGSAQEGEKVGDGAKGSEKRKRLMGDLATNLKKTRQAMVNLFVALLVLLLLVMYARNAVKSFTGISEL